jgi:Raf kinase inhibitor-like YbhB/YbcL family protein
MQLTSPAFQNNSAIPLRYTGEGGDISPPLEWSYVPEHCKAFALLCEDPDAPVRPGKEHPFAHWLIYNIPARITALPEGLPTREILLLPIFATQGRNSFGKIGYGGPMPPVGHGQHHYYFTLFALSSSIPLASGMRREAFILALQGHVIEKTTLVGTYERVAVKKTA